MSEIQIRKATPADVPFLVPSVIRAFAEQPLTLWLFGKKNANTFRYFSHDLEHISPRFLRLLEEHG